MRYDFKKAKNFIKKNKDKIKSATLGMHEDWFWTAQEVFKDGKFTVNLSKRNLKIAGLNESYWATPVMDVEWKDGTTETYACHDGGEHRTPDVFAFMAQQGIITKELSAERNKIEIKEIV